ncbi:putative glycerol-3-phosphate transporter subunit; ATP-binding component of ABC superfamily [Vibrio nigripulchritudo SFn27]|uniref:Putative glycerol-3-phosphate transporter subunit ATP-binding component of ABC superfamily n=1 Tax=Vibrio nigripulchritudo TaxID=28173 RepID=U4KBR3_9VIBR|nr:sn-glycerol-3-phosphate ABC transporter ATP-binding protein UgpC [Vibrio nigripulchritudo]CCN82360.1 putative glycerol-3-phosphate transporter subunit; ATP-binding component of ABC superfamily [Vibrio nigripulchritudo BLFn1]CCN91346.1 putative glycerol-3-phosphate transporter subunit; ATP-binding component of ABC superfamily [Vibrio nigripulchritudo SFn27]CCN97511.1 putative glycerol-3-phosphate transporter subunit; ATP-binding component of ABC superfamily [Vibrio nigripulchritudo ENn2]CCO38
MEVLSLKNIYKSFGQTEVLKDINLSIEQGEFIVFVGQSGCGKSTLLRLIAGLELQSYGDVFIDGTKVNDVAPGQRGLAMVFQSYALYPHMNVWDNMAFALKTARLPKDAIAKRVKNAAEILKLEYLLDRKPAELSGGQRQRVAIGRAIVREPKIFLFDEPLSNLDAELRVDMRVEIATLHKRLDATTIYVTHDQVEAMTLADKIVVMNNGVIEQFGSPLDVYNKPKNRFVAGFIGSPKMNFIEGEMKADGFYFQGGHLDLVEGKLMDKKMMIGVRPKDIALSLEPSSNDIKAHVTHTEILGGESYVYCKVSTHLKLVVAVDGQHRYQPDTEVWLALDWDEIHCFDANGKNIDARTNP